MEEMSESKAQINTSDASSLELGDKNELLRELTGVLNKHCAENETNTPDFILSKYLFDCLMAWNAAFAKRNKWYEVPHKA